MSFIYLLFDCVLVAFSSRELLLRLQINDSISRPEWWLAMLLMIHGQIVLLTLVFGYTGMFTNLNLSLGFGAVFLVARYFRRSSAEVSPEVGLRRISDTTGVLCSRFRLAMFMVVCLSVLLMVTAAASFPLNFDSQCYRLSRIGYWLQESSVRHFATWDDRHSYSGVNGDFIIMWLLGHFSHGYPLSNFAQAISGVMLLLSVWCFVRLLGWGPLAGASALLSLFTVPLFVAQFTTSQNDLIVASMIFAGLYFFTRAVLAKSLSLMFLGGVGIALACGTKGTVFYWGLGLVIYSIVLLAVARPGVGWITKAVAIGVVCLCVLGAPRYVENWTNWGNPFGSPSHYEQMHGHEIVDTVKLTRNLESLFIQNIAPLSNSSLLKIPLEWLSRKMVDRLSHDSNPHYMIGRDRRESLEAVLNRPNKNSSSDFGSLGLVISLMLLVAFVWVFWKLSRSRGAGEVHDLLLLGALIVSVIAYVLVFAALFKYHFSTSRYFLMLAPVGALSAAFVIEQLRGRVQSIAFYVLLLLAVTTAGETYLFAGNSGFENIVQARTYRTRVVFNAQAQVVKEEMRPGERLAFNLGQGSVISAGLFRHHNGVTAHYIPIEAVLEYPTIGSFLRANAYDSIILDTSEALPSDDVYRRVFAYEGKSDKRYSFRFHRLGKSESGNLHVSDLGFQTDGHLDLYNWSLVGRESEELSLVVKNLSNQSLRVQFFEDLTAVLVSIDAQSSKRIDLKMASGDQHTVRCLVEAGGAHYEVQLDGATPLVDPYLFE